MKKCLASDLGGTKILVAEVLEDGSIVHLFRTPSKDGAKRDRILQVVRAVKEYEKLYGFLDGVRPEVLGIGVNDVADPEGCRFLGHDPEDPVLDVSPLIREELGMDVRLDNDVKCTVLAENRFGAGQMAKNLLYLNIGTGLAAGIIANGEVVRGSDGFAGEVGFMDFSDGEGPHVELQASGMGIRYLAERMKKDHPESMLFINEDGSVRMAAPDGERLFTAAAAGDPLALLIRERLIRSAALLISNLTCVLSPERVVLGGGLMSDPEIVQEISRKRDKTN